MYKHTVMKKYFHYQGKKIFYSDEGKGTVIVLIHGYLETGDIWAGFITRLSSSFRVITVDLPGHGISDMFSEIHTMEFLAESINGLLNANGVEKAFLVGHSLGGYVVLAFLELHPERLTGYCLFHSHPLEDSPAALEKREREIVTVRCGKKYLIYPDNVRRMFAEKNLERFSAEFENSKRIASEISAEGIVAVLKGMMARPSRLALMEEGKVPCLWILGLLDNYIPCEDMQKKIDRPGNCRVEVLDNTGHMGFVEEADRSAMIIRDFVRSLEVSG